MPIKDDLLVGAASVTATELVPTPAVSATFATICPLKEASKVAFAVSVDKLKPVIGKLTFIELRTAAVVVVVVVVAVVVVVVVVIAVVVVVAVIASALQICPACSVHRVPFGLGCVLKYATPEYLECK